MVCLLPGAVASLLILESLLGSITGRVQDGETGDALAGAIVTLPAAGRSVETRRDGTYVVTGVPAGPQVLSVHHIGYAPRTLDALVPATGTLEITIALEPQPFHLAPVEVRALSDPHSVRDAPAGSRADRSASSTDFRDHVLSAEPDPFHAIGGGEVVTMPETPDGLHVHGGAADHVAYAIDGIPILTPYHSAGLFSTWNPDVIEDVALYSSTAAPSRSNALSGVVEARTRSAADRLNARGSVSSTHASLTVDGPLGNSGATALVSARSGFHDLFSTGEASFVRGDTHDWLSKLEMPSFGGTLAVLAYSSEDDLNSAAGRFSGTDVGQAPTRNVFEWESQSLGGSWTRAYDAVRVRLVGWSALTDAGAMWRDSTSLEVTSTRNDEGLLAGASFGPDDATELGLRLERSAAHFRLIADVDSIADRSLRTRTPIATVFAQTRQPLGRGFELTGGASLTRSRDWHLGPRALLRWSATPRVEVRASYARVHQFVQSLRNAESVVGNLFPADLFLGAEQGGVENAESDRASVSVEVHASSRVRFSVLAYEQASRGLVLVAPSEGGPFSTGGLTTGSGSSRAVSIETSWRAAPRLTVVGGYTLQRVRYSDGERHYTPIHGATHLVDGGLSWKPRDRTLLKLGMSASFGRRTSSLLSGFEWEACNLLDQGCEFGGNPTYDTALLGDTRLPAYLRIDLGFRKGWRVGAGSSELGLYGTVTNLLGRRNILTYAHDTSTEALYPIEMRPRAPLVVGLDYRF
jgi:hypothetical protein